MEDERDRAQRRRLPPLGHLLSEGVGDLSQLLRLVPEIASSLRSIQRHTKNMDLEVTGMHAAVVSLGREVTALNAQITELDRRMGTVADAVTRLEPHIEDVNLAVRPLRRARTRFAARQGEPAQAVPTFAAEAVAAGPQRGTPEPSEPATAGE